MSNVSCQFCDVVAFFHSAGVLSRGIANRADQFISENRENLRDYGDLFALLDEKTGKLKTTFDSRNVSLFLDFCFANNLQNVDRIPALFLRYAKTVSRGIAGRVAERKKLTGSDRYRGLNYYSDSAFCIFSELAYCSTEWQIVRVESIHHETRSMPYLRTTESGIVEQRFSDRTVFILNNEIVCRNTERANLLNSEIVRCVGSWVAVSPNGEIVMPAKRERFFDEKTQTTKTRIVEIEPSFSFLRILWIITSNSFFSLELGPQDREFDELSTELADNRRKIGYRESVVDEFQTILDSEKFSDQEKNIVRALDATFDHKFDNGIFDICRSRYSVGSGQMLKFWYSNYCAVANTEPHFEHFRKMVKNFRRHVRREFNIED